MSDLKPQGTLARLEKRAVGKIVATEFLQLKPVDFSFTRRAIPQSPYQYECDGIKYAMELSLGATYTILKGDEDIVAKTIESNAQRAICRCLYEDVIEELLMIMKVVGDGKRSASMKLLSDLYTRLAGNDD